MPPLETFDRRQYAVLWPAGDPDEFGEITRGTAVEIKVRWTYTAKEGVSANGQPISIDAEVVVDRDIDLGSQMWLGRLADFDEDESDNEILYVANLKKATDLKNRFTRRVLQLTRSKNSLTPTS